jgi:hypothetical protein
MKNIHDQNYISRPLILFSFSAPNLHPQSFPPSAMLPLFNQESMRINVQPPSPNRTRHFAWSAISTRSSRPRSCYALHSHMLLPRLSKALWLNLRSFLQHGPSPWIHGWGSCCCQALCCWQLTSLAMPCVLLELLDIKGLPRSNARVLHS